MLVSHDYVAMNGVISSFKELVNGLYTLRNNRPLVLGPLSKIDPNTKPYWPQGRVRIVRKD